MIDKKHINALNLRDNIIELWVDGCIQQTLCVDILKDIISGDFLEIKHEISGIIERLKDSLEYVNACIKDKS